MTGGVDVKGEESETTIRALIADDDRVARQIVARTLARWKFEVVAVGNGTDAWAYLVRAPGPTLAILDWMMPGFDGPEVCRRVRAERPNANLYLMLLTALESRTAIVAGLDAGADDFVVKPCDPGTLVQEIERLLANRDAGVQPGH